MISTVIWISSNEAKSFRLNPDQIQERHFHAHETVKDHHENAERTSPQFFREIAAACTEGNKDRYLILGPGQAKLHFVDYLKRHHAAAAERIAGVESVDKMTQGELLDFAHRFFKKADAFETIG